MNHLPLFLEIKDRPVLVVGGGEAAARRVETALKAGARVTVVATEAGPALKETAKRDGVDLEEREFRAADVEGRVLVFVATGDDDLNRRVSSLARDAGIPVNVADRLSLCTFIMPAVIDRSPVLVAVSSGGEAPILSRVLRARLETFVPAGIGRRRFWEDFIDGPIAEYILAGQEDAARNLLDETLDKAAEEQKAGQPSNPEGEVYLVGSGPGDPDLLTFRALRLMQRADVVLHDRLVPDGILDLVRRDAERIFVGKKPGDHTLRQEEISRLMIDLARRGKRVLRLKSGDPFVFGRGGEEIEALSSEGIPFQVVPGITAANGCASYAGIPLTHRDHAQSCMFVTGHMKDGRLDLNWRAMAQPSQTLVVYMGLRSLPEFTKRLIAHGADPATPAAIVDNGTRDQQQVITGALDGLAALAADAALAGPATIIIGDVVTLRDKLSWFKPRAGDNGGG
ncbi:MAG: uroporphyrinogen-III C-methyltransferase [Rhodospirillaceae bacterium]|nr:uroporphyrinogen-III C-methyltransferase [Rhodospirillaceae bacterium]